MQIEIDVNTALFQGIDEIIESIKLCGIEGHEGTGIAAAPDVMHVDMVQSDAVGSESCQPVCHTVSGGFIVKISGEAGVGSPKPDAPVVGGEVSVDNSDKAMLSGGSVEMVRNVRDVLGCVEGDHKGKQFAAEGCGAKR